jgi:hypothetical protein
MENKEKGEMNRTNNFRILAEDGNRVLNNQLELHIPIPHNKFFIYGVNNVTDEFQNKIHHSILIVISDGTTGTTDGYVGRPSIQTLPPTTINLKDFLFNLNIGEKKLQVFILNEKPENFNITANVKYYKQLVRQHGFGAWEQLCKKKKAIETAPDEKCGGVLIIS